MAFVVFFILILILYGALNYYVGLRGWQIFGRLLPLGAGVVYWSLFGLVASSFVIGFFSRGHLPEGISHVISLVGFYWAAAVIYLFLSFLVLDLLMLLNRKVGLVPDVTKFLPIAGVAVIVLVIGLIGYGVWNAQNTQVRSYEVAIGKQAGDIGQLRTVLVSDIHMGTIMDKQRISLMVDRVNALEPDLILLAGDLIDGNMRPVIKQNMQEELKQLKSRYGSFAVLGNHDHMGGIAEAAVAFLEECRIAVLRDNHRLVADSFYIAGREDVSHGGKRQDLETILNGVDRSKPLLLLDHQPFNLAEGQRLGVDIQLSGHTHNGQFFPFNLITGLIFEQDWGYIRKGDFHGVISCGFGTWGPPLRLASRSEIVLVTISFAGE